MQRRFGRKCREDIIDHHTRRSDTFTMKQYANSLTRPTSLTTSLPSSARAVGATFLSTAEYAESGRTDGERDVARWENEGGSVRAGI